MTIHMLLINIVNNYSCWEIIKSKEVNIAKVINDYLL